MSFDRRLRDELERDAARIPVDTERNLGAIEGRMRDRGPSLAPALIAVSAIVLVVLVRVAPPQSAGGPSSAPSPTPSANPVAEIAGIYRTTLDSADDPKVVGTWTMELRTNGTIVLSPPTSFSGASIPPSGISYSIEADRFRTDMFYNDFCTSVGTYAWSVRSGTLTLTPSVESCALRRTLLATSTWTRLP
jgi:hypothetical protein